VGVAVIKRMIAIMVANIDMIGNAIIAHVVLNIVRTIRAMKESIV